MDKVLLSPELADELLGKLCVEFGYCLPVGAHKRLVNSPPRTIDKFLDAVIVMEGLDPRACDHRKQMRAVVEWYFDRQGRGPA